MSHCLPAIMGWYRLSRRRRNRGAKAKATLYLRFFRVYCEEVFITKDTARRSRNQNEKGRIHHEGTKDTKVFVGCASRTGQSRNISRKACPEQRRRNAKAAKVGEKWCRSYLWIIYLSLPNLASFASWRESIPRVRVFQVTGKFAPAAQNFMHSSTRFSPDCAGEKRFACWRTAATKEERRLTTKSQRGFL